MVNHEKLREKVRESGITWRHIAKCLELSPPGLSAKVNGKSDFKADEIAKLRDVLHLKDDEFMAIFFAEDVA